MKRALLTPLALILLVFSGCGDDDGFSEPNIEQTHQNSSSETEPAMLILGLTKPDSTTCELNASVDGPFMTRGTLDLLLSKKYTASPVLLSRHSNEDGILLTEAEFSFTTNIPGLKSVLARQLRIPVPARLFPESSLALSVEVISEALGRQIEGTTLFVNRGTLVSIAVHLKLYGVVADGTVVASEEITFPLDICSGCLLYYPAESLFDDDDGSSTCDPAHSLDAVVMAPDDVCMYGQDEPVDCRLCRSNVGDPLRADIICDPN